MSVPSSSSSAPEAAASSAAPAPASSSAADRALEVGREFLNSLQPERIASQKRGRTKKEVVKVEKLKKAGSRLQKELLLLVQGLGSVYVDPEQDETRYERGEECIQCMKDLNRFIGRDDPLHRPVFRQLGEFRTLQDALVPLLITYGGEDRELCFFAIRLMTNMILPPPEDTIDLESQLNMLREYKESLLRHDVLSVIMLSLVEPLAKVEEDRSDRDVAFIELVLHLFVDLLHVPNTNVGSASIDSDSQRRLQDTTIVVFHQENVLDTLTTIAGLVNEEEEYEEFNLLLLEAIVLLIKDKDPDEIARSISASEAATSAASKAPAKADPILEERSAQLKQQENIQKAQVMKRLSLRHSRFGGFLLRQNIESGIKSVINPALSQDPEAMEAQRKTKNIFKKTQLPAYDEDKSRLSTSAQVRGILKDFCIQFLESGAFNTLTESIKYDLAQNKTRLISSDELHLQTMCSFFLSFNQSIHAERSAKKQQYPEVGYVTHALDRTMFTYVTKAIANHHAEKDWRSLFASVSLQKSMFVALESMSRSKESDLRDVAMSMEASIFYEVEALDMFATLLKTCEAHKHTNRYLCDLVEIVHLLMRMMDSYMKQTESEYLLVHRRRKKQVRKKAKKQLEQEETEAAAAAMEKEKVGEQQPQQPLAEGQEKERQVEPMQAEGEQGHNKEKPVEEEDAAAGEREREEQSMVENPPDEVIIPQESESSASTSVVPLQKEPQNPEPNNAADNDMDAEKEKEKEKEIRVEAEPSEEEEQQQHEKEPVVEAPASSAADPAAPDAEKPAVDPNAPPAQEEVVDSEEEEEDDDDDGYVDREMKLSVVGFVSKFANQSVIANYIRLLQEYRLNGQKLNHMILRFFERVCTKAGLESMFYQFSFIRLSEQVLNDTFIKKDKAFTELIQFCKTIVRHCMEVVAYKPDMMAELMLFWKTKSEALTMNDWRLDAKAEQELIALGLGPSSSAAAAASRNVAGGGASSAGPSLSVSARLRAARGEVEVEEEELTFEEKEYVRGEGVRVKNFRLNRVWTAEEDAILTENFPKYYLLADCLIQLATLLKTKDSEQVRRRINALKLKSLLPKVRKPKQKKVRPPRAVEGEDRGSDSDSDDGTVRSSQKKWKAPTKFTFLAEDHSSYIPRNVSVKQAKQCVRIFLDRYHSLNEKKEDEEQEQGGAQEQHLDEEEKEAKKQHKKEVEAETKAMTQRMRCALRWFASELQVAADERHVSEKAICTLLPTSADTRTYLDQCPAFTDLLLRLNIVKDKYSSCPIIPVRYDSTYLSKLANSIQSAVDNEMDHQPEGDTDDDDLPDEVLNLCPPIVSIRKPVDDSDNDDDDDDDVMVMTQNSFKGRRRSSGPAASQRSSQFLSQDLPPLPSQQQAQKTKQKKMVTKKTVDYHPVCVSMALAKQSIRMFLQAAKEEDMKKRQDMSESEPVLEMDEDRDSDDDDDDDDDDNGKPKSKFQIFCSGFKFIAKEVDLVIESRAGMSDDAAVDIPIVPYADAHFDFLQEKLAIQLLCRLNFVAAGSAFRRIPAGYSLAYLQKLSKFMHSIRANKYQYRSMSAEDGDDTDSEEMPQDMIILNAEEEVEEEEQEEEKVEEIPQAVERPPPSAVASSSSTSKRKSKGGKKAAAAALDSDNEEVATSKRKSKGGKKAAAAAALDSDNEEVQVIEEDASPAKRRKKATTEAPASAQKKKPATPSASKKKSKQKSADEEDAADVLDDIFSDEGLSSPAPKKGRGKAKASASSASSAQKPKAKKGKKQIQEESEEEEQQEVDVFATLDDDLDDIFGDASSSSKKSKKQKSSSSKDKKEKKKRSRSGDSESEQEVAEEVSDEEDEAEKKRRKEEKKAKKRAGKEEKRKKKEEMSKKKSIDIFDDEEDDGEEHQDHDQDDVNQSPSKRSRKSAAASTSFSSSSALILDDSEDDFASMNL